MIGLMTLEKGLEILSTDKKFRNGQIRVFKRILSVDEDLTIERIYKIIDMFDEAGFPISFKYNPSRKWSYIRINNNSYSESWYLGLKSTLELLETPRNFLLEFQKNLNNKV